MQRARSRIWSRNASSWGISSCFTRVRLFVTLWTIVCWAPLSKGFSRQEYWRGLPCRPSGDLHIPGIKPESPVLAGNFFTTSATWEGGGISPKSSCQGVTCRLESQCCPKASGGAQASVQPLLSTCFLIPSSLCLGLPRLSTAPRS